MIVYGINWECVYYVVHVSANVPATPPYIYSPISVRYTLPPPSGGADSRPPRVSCRCLAAPYNSLVIQIGGHRRTTDDIYIYIHSNTTLGEYRCYQSSFRGPRAPLRTPLSPQSHSSRSANIKHCVHTPIAIWDTIPNTYHSTFLSGTHHVIEPVQY